MLEFKCSECDNTTTLVYRDEDGDLITECLACEDIQVVSTNIGIEVQ